MIKNIQKMDTYDRFLEYGEIHLVDLGEYEGYRIGGVRPCIVLKHTRKTVILVPITRFQGSLDQGEIYIGFDGGLVKESKAKVGQIHTVCQSKIKRKLGDVSNEVRKKLKNFISSFLL